MEIPNFEIYRRLYETILLQSDIVPSAKLFSMSRIEQRNMGERRTEARPFHHQALLGRRRLQRRSSDAVMEQGCGDIYPRRLLLVTVAVLLLCALDAHNTLLILDRGGREVNPLMDFLIQTDIHLFVIGKFLLTGLGILLFVGYYRRRLWSWVRAGHLLYGLLGFYLMLVGYQFILLAAPL